MERLIEVQEVVSFGFWGQKIEGTVWAVPNPQELGRLLPENPPGNILAVSNLGWNEWFLNIALFDQFDAVLADGRTSVLCHAAILMRELGFVCITVWDLFEKIKDGDQVKITIRRGGWRKLLKDLLYNIRHGKHLLRYPRGGPAELVVLDKPPR